MTKAELRIYENWKNRKQIKAEMKKALAECAAAQKRADIIERQLGEASIYGTVRTYHGVHLVIRRHKTRFGEDMIVTPIHDPSRGYRSARVYTNANNPSVCGLSLNVNKDYMGQVTDVVDTRLKRSVAEAAAILYVATGKKPKVSPS